MKFLFRILIISCSLLFTACKANAVSETIKLRETIRLAEQQSNGFRVVIHVKPKGVLITEHSDRFLERVHSELPVSISLPLGLWKGRLGDLAGLVGDMREDKKFTTPAPRYVITLMGPWDRRDMAIGIDDVNGKVLYAGKVYEMPPGISIWISKNIEPIIGAIL